MGASIWNRNTGFASSGTGRIPFGNGLGGLEDSGEVVWDEVNKLFTISSAGFVRLRVNCTVNNYAILELFANGLERGGIAGAPTGPIVFYGTLGELWFQTQIANDLVFRPNQTNRMFVKTNGDVVIGNGNAAATVLATTAQFGFLRITTSAGPPTGAAVNGAIHLDDTNGKVYIRTGGAWVALN